MRMVVYKFPILEIEDFVVLDVPIGSKVVHCAVNNNHPTLWIELDADAPTNPQNIAIVGTGHPIPDPPLGCVRTHLGTVLVREFVWHFYSMGQGLQRA